MAKKVEKMQECAQGRKEMFKQDITMFSSIELKYTLKISQ